MYKRIIKRIIDLLLSTIGIVVLAIPMLVVAIIIKINSPGPALFKQKRVGIHKTEFTMLKFRSMPIDVPHYMPTNEFNAVDRINKFQRFIRKSSIDELPQLFNIWIGDMSIVGPRPVIPNEYDLIEARDRHGANDVKPGLTGWAQINGRDELVGEAKAKMDGEYVQKMSFLFDCKCIIKTVFMVLRFKGVVEGGKQTDHEEVQEKVGLP